MPLVMGVDSSTQSTKVEIRDADTGELVAKGKASHPPTGHAPKSEADPRDWWSAFERAYAAAGSPSVDAVAVAGQQHGMVVLDAAGEVIRPAKLWNDTESAPDAGWCVKQLPDGAAGWAHAVGSVPVASFTVSKLSWLHRSEPDAWSRVARVILPHDYLTWRLCGSLLDRFTTDRGDASGTGYWSPGTGEYRYDILAIIDSERDWNGVVPAVLGPLEHAGRWREAVVAPGTGDNMGAALGVSLDPGDVAVSLGTSGTVFAVSETPTADASGFVAGFADATGRYLPLVCTLNATKVSDAGARLLGVDHGEFDRLALAAMPGAGGLTLLPYLDGERTPNRPQARGTFGGMTSDVSREQFARATVEGVLCGLLDGMDALAAAGASTDGRLLLVGGGARSAAYRQVLADLTGRVVEIPFGDEFVAYGAARQAAAALHGSWPEWVGPPGIVVDPSSASEFRDEVRAKYGLLRDGTV